MAQRATTRGSGRGEYGQSVTLAILVVAMLTGVVAFAVDVGMIFESRRSEQNAVDAAALAGARELPFNPSLAESEARSWAAKNDVLAGDVLTVQVGTTNYPNDTIHVSVSGDSPAYFARVFDITKFTVSATGSARIGSPVGMDGFVPLAVLDGTFSGLNPGDSATLKYDSQDQTKGNTLALSFPGNSGGQDFRQAIFNGSPQTLCSWGYEYAGCPSSIDTEPGALVGPTKQGINDRLSATIASCDTYSEVFVPNPANPLEVSINPSCNPFPPNGIAGSRRVIIIPVIDHLCAGRCTVHIIRFAMFFLEGITCNVGLGSCSVVGKYAEASFDSGSLFMRAYDPNAGLKIVRLTE